MNVTTAHNPASFAGQYDVIVVAANPGGISCALRCAGEGLRVLLVEETRHVGGMWASGVQVFDTRYGGHRCPVLTEFVQRLEKRYRLAFGAGSREHTLAGFGDPARHGERPRFEPHVAEEIFRDMLRDAPGVTLALGFYPTAVTKDGDLLSTATFTPTNSIGGEGVRASARVFVDASYEADLAALAGASFRVGREGRDAFGEPHAGTYFTTIEPIGEVGRTIAGQLNLHFFNRTSRRAFPGTTGRKDLAVQAYTTRLILTDRPANRRPVERPAAYSRERYAGMLDRGPGAHARPYPLSSHYLHGPIEDIRFAANLQNSKMDWLGANLVGGNHRYPLADRSERGKIYRDHLEHALGLLYFLQNDPEVPDVVRRHAREWGLARDEYRDNDNLPHLLYVREARRLAGFHVFTEHDASRHPRHGRSPIHSDSIAIAEWPMDSHDCNPLRQPGSFNDGEFILAESTLPSQVPYRTMLTRAASNLLVPVSLSATHVGWGTLRLEPVFVHTGEAAGVAAALCVRDGVTAHALRPATLQWELLRRRIAVTYFADVDVGSSEPWIRDAQYLGARGFFAGYNANPRQIVSPALESAWQRILADQLDGQCDANEAAAWVAAALKTPTGASGGRGLAGLTVSAACQTLGAALRDAAAVAAK